jgi:AraC-like DNA-binding protein
LALQIFSAGRFSTGTLAERERFAFWKEAVCDTFVGLDVRRFGAGAFAGEITRSVAGEGASAVTFISVGSEGQSAERSPSRIRRDHESWILLGLQVGGQGILEHGERSIHLAPGDMALFDSTRPYRWVFREEFRQIVLRFPVAMLLPRLPKGGAWLGHRLSGRTALGRLVAEQVAVTSRALDTVGPDIRAMLAGQLVELLVAGVEEELRAFTGGGPPSRQALIARAKRIIQARLADPGLSVQVIADELGISTGYLHQLFRQTGETVGDLVRSERLERARRDLADPARTGESVTEIAMRWGFADLPTFSHAFRASFGQSPRDYRSAVR